ncbi:hypothetical protein GCM10027203_68390 [Nonomuraea fastidiosa]
MSHRAPTRRRLLTGLGVADVVAALPIANYLFDQDDPDPSRSEPLPARKAPTPKPTVPATLLHDLPFGHSDWGLSVAFSP